eukprot:m.33126 g.33126  ORF g.33126 m.33126 type:complete len:834 (+) comp6434_c0_seq1:225-2726(+)
MNRLYVVRGVVSRQSVCAMLVVVAVAVALCGSLSTAQDVCEFGDWSAFGPCAPANEECVKLQVRSLTFSSENATCPQMETNVVSCDPQQCIEYFCKLSDWSEWSPCTATCGPEATQTRDREVLVLANVSCDHLSGEIMVQTKSCNLPDCPSPEIVADGENLVVSVPEGKQITFKFGADKSITLDSIQDNLQSAISALESEQNEVLSTLQAEFKDDISILRGVVEEAETNALSNAKDYTDEVESTLNVALNFKYGQLDDKLSSTKGELLGAIADTEELLGKKLSDTNSTHIYNHNQQQLQIDGIISLLADTTSNLAILETNAANAEDIADSLSSLRADIDGDISTVDDELNAIRKQFLPVKSAKPSVTKSWADSLSLTWTPTPSATDIIKYIVTYETGSTSKNVETSTTSVVLEGLSVDTSYDITVTAKNFFGEGEASDVVTIKTPAGQVYARRFTCQYGSWAISFGSSPVVLCEIRFTTSMRTIIHGSFTGHMSTNTWVYGTVSIDGDDPTPGEQQSHSPAHSYTSTWETFGSDRTRIVDAGDHVIQARFRSGGSGSFNGGSLHVVAIAAPVASHATTFGCITTTGWSYGCAYPQTCRACSISGSALFPSVIIGAYTAHWRLDSNWAYGAVAINNDLSGSSVSDQNFSPSHSYSSGWENTRSVRIDSIEAGGFSMQPSLWKGSSGTVFFNGMGFSSFMIPRGSNSAGTFRCKPTEWSYRSQSNTMTPCTATIDLPVRSVVYGFYSGHAYTSGTCYGVVSFDNDGDAALNNYSTPLQAMAASHTYTPLWETFQSGRTIVMDAGKHTVSIQFQCRGDGYLNGSGLQGYWIQEGDF